MAMQFHLHLSGTFLHEQNQELVYLNKRKELKSKN
jgi:hypothetical protein